MRTRFFWILLFSFWGLCLNVLLMAASPVITSISPYVGLRSDGMVVAITGSGFTGATEVSFGGSLATINSISDNLITVTNPAHAPGSVFVSVTTPSGTSSNSPAAYFVYRGDWEAYVTNDLENAVFVIDTLTQRVIATITVGIGSFPEGIAITPDGTEVYVANFGLGGISVIDTATQRVIATITVGIGPQPASIAITPDGMQAYVTNAASHSVSIIDTATQMVVATIGVGTDPFGIAMTPDGMQAYVANTGSHSVSVIDTATPQMVIATITVGVQPEGVAMTPDGRQAYVTNTGTGSNSVSVIDTATPQIVITTTTVGIGIHPSSVAVTPDGMQAYVTNTGSNSVSVIDTATPQVVIATITVGVEPEGVAMTPDGMQAYVANDESVSIINTATRTSTIVTITLGLFQIAITPDQAPLARFTAAVAQAGSPSTFDASGSVSPVGTIATYSWNFGDGTTLNTSQPIVSHTYAASGNYSVTLTVTNSAGTSTVEIYTPPSRITNGGPSATSTQTITVPPIPPSPPTVQRIHPSSGPTCGGTVVTITGTNFTGATAVFFGSVPTAHFTIQSEMTILATSPPGKPGAVDITVVTPAGRSTVNPADQFTYLPPFPPKDLRGWQVKNRYRSYRYIVQSLSLL